jgi:plasmid maintenance system antidote protein VapI
MAIRFGKAFGVKAAETLMRMQSAYALAEARAREDEIEVEAACVRNWVVCPRNSMPHVIGP